MAIITTINATDNIGASRSTINDNFAALNTELSAIEPGAEVNNISDVNATDLTDGGDTTLHKHDGRYYTESEVDGFLAGKANTTHTHAISDVTGLQTALDSKANTGDLGDLAVLNIVDAENVTTDISLASTNQQVITDYTFTGTEIRNGLYIVTTASNRVVNISPDLFVDGVEFTFIKGTSDANTVTIDSGTGNNINGSQTIILSVYTEAVTIIKNGADTWKVKNYYTPLKTINGNSIKGTGDIVISGGGGSTAWGAITGTLSAQTDLQSALDAKLNSSAITNGSLGVYADTVRFDTAILLTASTDLNTLLISGFYNVQNASNRPTGSTSWIYVEVLAHSNSSNYVTQKAWSMLTADPIMYIRNRNNGTRGTWREIPIQNSMGDYTFSNQLIKGAIIRPTLYDDQNPGNILPGGQDLLFYAVERGLAVTASRDQSSGILSDMFNLGNTATKWNAISAGNPVSLEIELSTASGPYINDLAIIHSWRDNEANNYVIETFNDNNNDGTYERQTHHTITNNTKYIVKHALNVWRVRKIRITVTVAGNGGLPGERSVGTIMATSAVNGKATGAIAELGPNTFYGDQIYNTGRTTHKNASIINHTGNPEGAITAKPGSICMADTGVIYQKLTGTGNTGRAVIGGSSGTPIQNEVVKIRSFI